MTQDRQTSSYVHVNPNFLGLDPGGGGRDGYSAAAAYNQQYSHYRHAGDDDGRDMGHHGDARCGEALTHMRMQMSDARRMRKTIFRRTIDYNTPVMAYLEDRIYRRTPADRRWIQSDYLYQGLMVPPFDMLDTPMNCVTTKHVRTSTNKNKCPIFALCWTPEGRRLITGSSSGEFTLWNGLTFNFETILQAHDSPIRCMLWSHNEDWLLTADNAGFVKYWQANMNNVKVYQAHKDPVRGVSFCCSDSKFVTCSDDSTVRVWDFVRCQEERVLRGHGADVRCVAWHPWRSLVISGSKDAQQPIKLWDPKSGQSLATLYVHKNTCTDVAWNANGNWFLTASRDHQIKLFDVRNMRREVQIYRGHRKDVMRVAWHPHHESLFASGGADGAIMYWMVGAEMEVGAVEDAHEHMIWSLAWHPLGHIIVSGSNDFTTKFWTRNRPGDVLRESAARAIANTSFLSNPSGAAVGTPGRDREEKVRPAAMAASVTAAAPGAEKAVTNTAAALTDDGAVVIPGLFEGAVSDQNVTSDDLDEKARKARLQKSIPRAFAANWASARSAAMPALLPNPVQPIEPTISAPVATPVPQPPGPALPARPAPSSTPFDFDNMSVLDEGDYDTQSVMSEPPAMMVRQQQQQQQQQQQRMGGPGFGARGQMGGPAPGRFMRPGMGPPMGHPQAQGPRGFGPGQGMPNGPGMGRPGQQQQLGPQMQRGPGPMQARPGLGQMQRPPGGMGPHGNMGPPGGMGPHGNMGTPSGMGPHGNMGPPGGMGPAGGMGHPGGRPPMRGPGPGPGPQGQGGPGGFQQRGGPPQRFQRPGWSQQGPGPHGPQGPMPPQQQQQQQQQPGGGPWAGPRGGPPPGHQQRFGPPQRMPAQQGPRNDFDYERDYGSYEAESDFGGGGPGYYDRPMDMGGPMKRGPTGGGPRPPMPKQPRGGAGGPFRGGGGRGVRGRPR